MGIGIQREARRVVTQHGGHRFHVHSVLQSHGCEGMTQVMEANAWQPRSFQHPLEHVQDAVRGHGAAAWRLKIIIFSPTHLLDVVVDALS